MSGAKPPVGTACDISTTRGLAHAHLGACPGEHSKACDMLTLEFAGLFTESASLRERLATAEADRDLAGGVATAALADAAALRGRVTRAEALLAELQAALGMDEPYSVLACLDQLAIAADHLLKAHDCDAHGWEGVGIARDYARAHHERLARVLAPTEPDGASEAKEK